MVYSRHLRFLINTFFSLVISLAGGLALANAVADPCSSLGTDLRSYMNELGEVCNSISDSGIEGCGQVETQCGSIEFDEHECLNANVFNRENCTDIVRVDGERPRDETFENRICATAVSHQMSGLEEENDELGDDLRDLRSERGETASNTVTAAQAIADMAQQNAEIEQQGMQQKAEATDRAIQEMARADDNRRQTIDQAKQEARRQEDLALQQRAEYRMAGVQISEKLAELNIACLDLESQLRVQTDQMEAERIAVRQNRAACNGPTISCALQDEGITEQEIMTARDDCLFGEKSDRVQAQIAAEADAIAINTQEALAMAQARLAEADNEKNVAEAQYLLAVRQIEENHIRAQADVDRSLASQKQAVQNGAMMQMATALAGGGGVGPGGAVQDPQTAALNQDIEEKERRKTLNQCVLSCGSRLGGSDAGEPDNDDSGVSPVVRARTLVGNIQSACEGNTQCSAVCSGYLTRVRNFSGRAPAAREGDAPVGGDDGET